MTFADEQALIRRCQGGDLDAFGTIYRHYESRMLSLAYRLMGNQEEAEDALQEAFIKAFRSMGQYRSSAAFSTWLYRIVLNACYDALRRRKRTRPAAEENLARIPSHDHTDLRVHLQRAIAGLPDRLRTSFVLYAQEGFKQREIAELMDTKEGTVKRYVFEARAHLREAMGPYIEGRQVNEVP